MIDPAWPVWPAEASGIRRLRFSHFGVALSAAVDGLGVVAGRSPMVDAKLAAGKRVMAKMSHVFALSWRDASAAQDRLIAALRVFALEGAAAASLPPTLAGCWHRKRTRGHARVGWRGERRGACHSRLPCRGSNEASPPCLLAVNFLLPDSASDCRGNRLEPHRCYPPSSDVMKKSLNLSSNSNRSIRSSSSSNRLILRRNISSHMKDNLFTSSNSLSAIAAPWVTRDLNLYARLKRL